MQFLKTLFLNIENKVSLTKVGAFIFAVGTFILANNLLPDSFDILLKTIITIGGYFAGVGARNALDKIGKKEKATK